MTEELNLKNIKNRLKRHGFSSSCADKLGEQLDEVSPGDIETIKKNHNWKDWDGILSDVIKHWLNNDSNQSWEKLAQALSDSGFKAIAAKILGDEPLDSGTSTAKAKEEKELYLRQRNPTLFLDPKKPPSDTQRNLLSSQTLCSQSRLAVIGLFLLAIVFLFVFKGSDSNSSTSTGMRQKHTSMPDKGTSTIKLDSTDCTTIESAKKLENVLKEVSTVQYDKMCRDLNITSATCNGMERKDPFTLSRKYMEQHPEPCWENIVKMLCDDFGHYTLARTVKGKYGIPEQVYIEHCTRK